MSRLPTNQARCVGLSRALSADRTSRRRLAMPGSRRLASKRSLLSGSVAARSCTALCHRQMRIPLAHMKQHPVSNCNT